MHDVCCMIDTRSTPDGRCVTRVMNDAPDKRHVWCTTAWRSVTHSDALLRLKKMIIHSPTMRHYLLTTRMSDVAWHFLSSQLLRECMTMNLSLFLSLPSPLSLSLLLFSLPSLSYQSLSSFYFSHIYNIKTKRVDRQQTSLSLIRPLHNSTLLQTTDAIYCQQPSKSGATAKITRSSDRSLDPGEEIGCRLDYEYLALLLPLTQSTRCALSSTSRRVQTSPYVYFYADRLNE